MNRRAFLQSVATGTGVVGLAGCLGSGGNPIQISYIDIVNSDGQALTVAVEVMFDGDAIVDETYELAGDERTNRIQSELPEQEGEYEITVDPEGISAETFVPGSQTEAECGWLEYEILDGERVLQRFDDDC